MGPTGVSIIYYNLRVRVKHCVKMGARESSLENGGQGVVIPKEKGVEGMDIWAKLQKGT